MKCGYHDLSAPGRICAAVSRILKKDRCAICGLDDALEVGLNCAIAPLSWVIGAPERSLDTAFAHALSKVEMLILCAHR